MRWARRWLRTEPTSEAVLYGAGTRFLVTEDLQATALIHFRTPFTDGVKCVVPGGTIVHVDYDVLLPRIRSAESESSPRAMNCLPENYAELERVVVPEATRLWPNYDGYHFVIPLAEAGSKFRVLGPTA